MKMNHKNITFEVKMSSRQDEQDFQKFLRDVDEITNLIQGLNSTDVTVQEKAMAETEKRLVSTAAYGEDGCKYKVDRTLINTETSTLPDQDGVMNPESFMAAVEKDAKQRARKRKENEALANALKQEGNDAFSKGDYEMAIQKYTEGLKKQKDMQVLYTNRAQCDEKCIKALFHMGKAYLAQKEYIKSRECYQKILEFDPQKEKLCKGCLNEVDLEEKKQCEEEKALRELESGKHSAVSVNELLQKLNKPDENILYYAGGIRLLTDLIRDGNEQIVFRTNNGFSIISDHEVIRPVFCAKTESSAEVELVLSLLFLWQEVCKGNEENQRLLLTHPDVNLQLPTLLVSEVPEIQEHCLALLCLFAETDYGRNLLIRHLDTTKWLQIFLSFIKYFDNRAKQAMNILTNLIMDDKFKVQCRIKLSTGTLPVFMELLDSVKIVDEFALAQGIAIMGDLCSDVVIQMQIAESQECWQTCLNFVDKCWNEIKITRYSECLHALLGLLMNLSVEPNLIIQDLAVDIAGKCISLFGSKDGRIVTRAIGLLSRVLPADPAVVEESVKQGVVNKLIKFLKVGGETTTGYAMKTLAVCAESSQQAQQQIVKSDKKCKLLLKLLCSPNELVAGNAAFCLGKCLEVPGEATNMLDTDVVKVLLKVAGGDAQRNSVQENAAIALGKLCTADARHISRLRELNGMAILKSSMKYVQES
uniref:Tetratricopeptide repeat protein 12 n=3 Tax=Salvator merianae TaxID=96440 RepID=A0A8D0E8E1_SALMN